MSRHLLLAVPIFGLAACGGAPEIALSEQTGPNPVLAKPHEKLLPDVRIPAVVGWKPGETPTVPAGFTITALATGLNSPRTVHALPNGDVLVVQSSKAPTAAIERPKALIFSLVMKKSKGKPKGETNRLLLLRDADGDGRAERANVLLRGLNSPFGLVQRGNALFVASTDAILRFPFSPGDIAVRGRGVKVTDLPAGPANHHWTKDLTIGPDGSKLYVGVGSNSNAMERGFEAETGRAAIWEVDAATGAKWLFASGLRNPNGLTFYPGSNTLWTVVNERDELGPDLVPDYMTSVRPGGFYGWPYSYYGRNVDVRVKPARPDLVERAISPDYALGSHVAALGLAFYTGDSFPAGFRGGAFVGEHGSWNRKDPSGYKVVFIRFANGRPVGKPIDFVSGFLGKDGKARGRPVGVAVDRTGALLIADDAGGTVWRVSFTPRPAAASAPRS